MMCVYCGAKTKTVNSRRKTRSNQTWRRRQCLRCNSIFTTHETLDYDSAIRVMKASRSLESLSRDRIFIDVFVSMSHRKTALSDAGALTDTILGRILSNATNGVIQHQDISATTLEILNNFDIVAATYYAAHHKN